MRWLYDTNEMAHLGNRKCADIILLKYVFTSLTEDITTKQER